jgi:hypothetical protein
LLNQGVSAPDINIKVLVSDALFTLKKIICSFSGILFCISAQASECTIDTVDLSETIKPLSEVVNVSSNKSTDGYETYLRQVFTLPTRIIVSQY